MSLTMSSYHTKLPIDNDKLRRWDDYLAFIEDKDISKVINLYERCLISCAYRPTYWVRCFKGSQAPAQWWKR
ncbi:BnaC08g43910D [Brassica napus]|uniref:BnaC08g43910D protein n=1 Tax=Brassica napus TaxID=3708 RepID=A0A078F6H5_BRANA|nr:BnaC08g43910D [Brassica napus]